VLAKRALWRISSSRRWTPSVSPTAALWLACPAGSGVASGDARDVTAPDTDGPPLPRDRGGVVRWRMSGTNSRSSRRSDDASIGETLPTDRLCGRPRCLAFIAACSRPPVRGTDVTITVVTARRTPVRPGQRGLTGAVRSLRSPQTGPFGLAGRRACRRHLDTALAAGSTWRTLHRWRSSSGSASDPNRAQRWPAISSSRTTST
jgi:hypothetical protein